MANGLGHYAIPGSEETAQFVRMFDRVLDCLNVRSHRAVKPDRRGYTSATDGRLEVTGPYCVLLAVLDACFAFASTVFGKRNLWVTYAIGNPK